MRRMVVSAAAAGLAMAVLAVHPSVAQKSADTLRLVIGDPFTAFDPYHVPQNEPGQYFRAYYGKLLEYDEFKGEFIPELAKAWRRIDPVTWEFDLRDDITWTSGNKFSADDVKYTIDYVRDPALKIAFKPRYDWIRQVEVLSPTKVRIVGNAPRADDILNLTYFFYIFDKKVHEALPDKSLYGAVSASTTGVYKLLSISANAGVDMVRNDAAIGKFPHRRAPIREVKGIPIPDPQTQLAEFMAGHIDVFRNPAPDMESFIKTQTGVQIDAFPTRNISYIMLDAAGRSDNKVFRDIRVRQAFMKAIDREAIIKTYVAGNEVAIRPNAVCYDDNVGCAYTTKPVAYDPEGAKKLLAEAGYPNGFDMELGAFVQYGRIATAIAGELRKVNIRATVQPMPLSVATRRRGRGELTALYGGYPTFIQPDVANIMTYFFSTDDDYSQDPVIWEARDKGLTELDPEKRKAIYRAAMDRVNEMSYIMPFVEQANTYVHRGDLEIRRGTTSNTEVRPSDYFWK